MSSEAKFTELMENFKEQQSIRASLQIQGKTASDLCLNHLFGLVEQLEAEISSNGKVARIIVYSKASFAERMLEDLRMKKSASLLSLQEAKKTHSRQLELLRLKERELELIGREKDVVFSSLVASEKTIGELKARKAVMEEEESALREQVLDDYLRDRSRLRETLVKSIGGGEPKDQQME